MSWIHKFDGSDKKLDKNFGRMDEFYDKVIDEHICRCSLKTGVEEDFVDVLLRVQKDPSQGISLTRDNIKGILMVGFSFSIINS
ncbi:hypothetical protein C5167_050864 [Papaver somniferum]|uniref:Uncharacterized protein n=1 Tax=Papaver somniferum TaxID=3469 RepID=A0A4Y7KRB2_PAPSO|nr:hypothetical protein C5167_050864 [Papaver somniferum]